MKIYFCDICNESIPLTDLKDGRASTIKGKIFCGNCNPLNTVPESKKDLRGAALEKFVTAKARVLGVEGKPSKVGAFPSTLQAPGSTVSNRSVMGLKEMLWSGPPSSNVRGPNEGVCAAAGNDTSVAAARAMNAAL